MMSLLYSKNELPVPQNETACPIPHELMLDEVFLEICPDVNSREYFLKILACSLSEEADIYYRREILTDFMQNTSVLFKLEELFKKLNQTLDDYNEKERQNIVVSNNRFSESSVYVYGSKLQIGAIYLSDLCAQLREISLYFESLSFKSKGLESLKERFACFARSDELNKIIDICQKYENFSYHKNINLHLLLDDESRINSASFVGNDTKEESADGQKNAFSLFKRFRKEESEENNILPPARLSQSESNILIGNAVNYLSSAFSKIIKSISEEFKELCRELVFYIVSANYIKYLEQLRVGYVYANISKNGEISASELYDIFLVGYNRTTDKVVPNDFFIPEKAEGMLIKGANSSGKTVYLRSVATALILTMAGLPIPAKEAKIPVCSLFMLFASKEKGLNESVADAGRFEEEVRDFSQILDKIKPGSFVVLNEIFQTTAYSEGAEGLYYILKYLSRKNVKWLLVTHMLGIFDLFDGDEAVKIEFCEKTHKAEYLNF